MREQLEATQRLSKNNVPKTFNGMSGKKRCLKLNTPRTLMRLMQQHRENERHRHRGLNASINDIVKRIPGYDVHPKGSKIDKLRRVISYICYLEENIETIFQDLGVANSFEQSFLSFNMAKPASVRAVTRRSRRCTVQNGSIANAKSTHRKKKANSFAIISKAEEELVCADVIDESGEVADVELQTDNEDTFIAPCEKNLQHHSDQEPEKNESRAEQLSTCLGWDRVEEEEPADGAEPDTVIRVPDQSSSRPLVRRNLPVVRVTQAVDCSSDGKSRLRRAYVVVLPRMTLADRLMGSVGSWWDASRENAKEMPLAKKFTMAEKLELYS